MFAPKTPMQSVAVTPSNTHAVEFIKTSAIRALLEDASRPDPSRVRELIQKARLMKGLTASDVAYLLQTDDRELVAEMFEAARHIKDEIYGKRLVLFAPLYYSNACTNDCLYCGFRKSNPQRRRRLSLDEVAAETRKLEEQGHKRVLVIAGETGGSGDVDFLLEVIETVYATKSGRGEIRRVNVECAPMTVEEFRRLKHAKIGTYVVFQETYNRDTYRLMHPSGPKADYDYRLTTMDRAMAAGIDDVGIGALFGLHDYREEVLGLLFHAQHLEAAFGTGPHTISVPRIELADGAPMAMTPPHPVDDDSFRKIVAILRMAVPYTGIILSTRETAVLRTELLDLGISQMSAGSRTEPGGYSEGESATAQFCVGDSRSLDEVICDIARHGYVPSFCTGCYRKGRTGQDFMDLAKPGLIHMHCLPNALLTFKEYLLDYASEQTREVGFRLIRDQLASEVPAKRQSLLTTALARMDGGERDIYF